MFNIYMYFFVGLLKYWFGVVFVVINELKFSVINMNIIIGGFMVLDIIIEYKENKFVWFNFIFIDFFFEEFWYFLYNI